MASRKNCKVEAAKRGGEQANMPHPDHLSSSHDVCLLQINKQKPNTVKDFLSES